MDKNAKIAITGGAGYIGSFTVKHLQGLGFENIVILDNFSTGHKSVCFARHHEVDLQDSSKLNDIFEKEHFDSVIHFASLIVVPHSMEDPYHYFHHNFNSSLNVLEAMKKHAVKHLVFSSTCALYGTPKVLPITEAEEVQPESVYAESKWMIERMIQWYGRLFGIKYALLRYFNACGAAPDASNGEMHSPETHLIPNAVVQVLKDEPITIYGNDYPTDDGTCVRDYIHVEDLASAHHRALEYLFSGGKSDIFNLGLGKGYSNNEVIDAIRTVAGEYGKDVDVKYEARRAGDVPELYADNTKARSSLSWEPTHTDLTQIVREAFAWHEKHL